MKKYYSIGQAAKFADTTVETLRHYDRKGILTPTKIDEESNYRYYSTEDIIKIKTIKALQKMDLSLDKIQEVLSYDDLNKIVDFLSITEQKAEEKIKSLQQSKKYIKNVKNQFLNKNTNDQEHIEKYYLQYFPKRYILLSDKHSEPTLDVLWNYLAHFYEILDKNIVDNFAFEDNAGVYTTPNNKKMFAVCKEYIDIPELITLPEGYYLCTDSNKENSELAMDKLMKEAKQRFNQTPKFSIKQVVISGILNWNYQLQVYSGK